MVFEYKHVRRVEFSDTDMAGIVHFSRFPIFMESAEHAFFRSLGYSIHTEIEGEHFGWPRLQVECKFRRPLRFEDEVQIHLFVAKVTNKTIQYHFDFLKLNADAPEQVASGSLTVICVQQDEAGEMRSTNIPGEIREKLETAPPGSYRSTSETSRAAGA